MDYDSFHEGVSGGAMSQGGDINSYRLGQAQSAAGAYQGNPTGGEQKAEPGFVPPMPKVDVNGVAYTMILISPMLIAVYPILGAMIYAIFLSVWGLSRILPIHPGFLFLGGAFLCVMSFFWGYKLEAMASRFKSYRAFRTIWRLLTPMAFIAGMAGRTVRGAAEANALGGAMFAAIAGTVIAFFLFKWFDRLYFSEYIPAPQAGSKEAKAIEAVAPIVISGLISERQAVQENKKYRFRIGEVQVEFKSDLLAEDGDFVYAAGLRKAPFEVLVLKKGELTDEVSSPKYPWVLSLLAPIILAGAVHPLVGLLSLYLPFHLFNRWRNRNKSIYYGREMIEAVIELDSRKKSFSTSAVKS